jgi:hypothetical protein
VLEAQVLDLRYHRVILESASAAATEGLKKQFDYSFVVSMSDFEDREYEVVQKTSSLLDVSKGIDAIIGKFNSTSRNEYRRTERNNELKFFTGYNDFQEYFAFYSKCEHDRQWFPVPPSELKNSILFTAAFRDQPISGMSCYGHGKRLRVGRIYSTKRSSADKELSNTIYGGAAKRIVVEICKYAIQHGYETVDLGGVDLSGAKSGITQFKLSLGGDIVTVLLGRFMKSNFKLRLPEIKSHGFDIT